MPGISLLSSPGRFGRRDAGLRRGDTETGDGAAKAGRELSGPRIQSSSKNRMAVLLVLIAAALLTTTLLARDNQTALLKSFLVLFMALLPGWLYLYFTHSRGTALYDEYVLNLYRLQIDHVANLPKPPPGSPYWEDWKAAVGEAPNEQVARNIYLKKFEAVYGRSVVPNSRRKGNSDDNDPDDLGKDCGPVEV